MLPQLTGNGPLLLSSEGEEEKKREFIHVFHTHSYFHTDIYFYTTGNHNIKVTTTCNALRS